MGQLAEREAAASVPEITYQTKVYEKLLTLQLYFRPLSHCKFFCYSVRCNRTI